MKWNSLTRGATRWWSAPARFPTPALPVLRKAVLSQYWAANPWLQQAPLRAQPAPSTPAALRAR
jgi:hypothetical protein